MIFKSVQQRELASTVGVHRHAILKQDGEADTAWPPCLGHNTISEVTSDIHPKIQRLLTFNPETPFQMQLFCRWCPKDQASNDTFVIITKSFEIAYTSDLITSANQNIWPHYFIETNTPRLESDHLMEPFDPTTLSNHLIKSFTLIIYSWHLIKSDA